MLARLRPHPHRGDVVAAGVVVLTLFAVVTDVRFATEWSDPTRLLFVAAVAAPVLAMAIQAGAGDAVPRPYEAVLLVASFLLVLLVLGELSRALGGGGGSGTVTWVGALLAAWCAWLARRRNSAIMTLLAAATGLVVAVAFVDWAFSPGSLGTFRWVLLAGALGLTLGAVHQRDARRRHAVALADAAGLAAIAIGATLVVDQLLGLFGGFLTLFATGGLHVDGGPLGWELVLLAFGFGLIAYGSVDRERVPAFLGVVVLVLFVTRAGVGATLIGWPIVLLVLAAVLLAVGLRPRRDLPPEPPVPTS